MVYFPSSHGMTHKSIVGISADLSHNASIFYVTTKQNWCYGTVGLPILNPDMEKPLRWSGRPRERVSRHNC
ncbi:hypothetical protein MAR_021030 [Mya arenaria]|uniref:Uncharacterized protein n=1 Tax=Mya arenaria TaxID=6604 RepID=A0ABY7E9R6_MYAAR|nr:hypothetical protein MAR_021030 [Mya arenaria]